MAIRRYKSEADTTITNAYKSDLATSATGSNMGESDVLEVFNIYAQAGSTSSEQSRILIKFPTTGIANDRAAAIVPASGKVKFYLKLYNVPHGETLPTNFNLEASPLTTAWDEGYGLDMEEYSDMGATGVGNTFGGTGASWTVASSGVNWVTPGGDYTANIGDAANTILLLHGDGTITDSSPSEHTVTASGHTLITTDTIINEGRSAFGSSCIKFDGTGDFLEISSSSDFDFGTGDFTIHMWVYFNIDSFDNDNMLANQWSQDPDHVGDWQMFFRDTDNGKLQFFYRSSSEWQASEITTTAVAESTWTHLAVVRSSGTIKFYFDGVEDATTITDSQQIGSSSKAVRIGKTLEPDHNFDGYLDEIIFIKGSAIDFTGAVPTSNYAPYVSVTSFEDGDEDLEVDITEIVESWISVPSSNHGLVIKLADTVEDGTSSFYTKKFSARGSEYFFNRPVIEARWDSSEKDDRNNFYAKSNLRSDADNQNVIAIKNYVDGILKDIDGVTGDMTVKFYNSSTDLTEISPAATVTSSKITGVYTVTAILDTLLASVYVKWQDSAGTPVVFHTETIEVKQRSVAAANIPEYVTTIQNFKKVYSNDEMARFRLFIRSKDWSPTIYTVATKELKSEVVEDAYYKIMRVVDDFTVIDYGSGTIPYTKLSYDENGPYFDFDMSMLETGWAYRIELMYKINGEMRQQPEAFKFRVVE